MMAFPNRAKSQRVDSTTKYSSIEQMNSDGDRRNAVGLNGNDIDDEDDDRKLTSAVVDVDVEYNDVSSPTNDDEDNDDEGYEYSDSRNHRIIKKNKKNKIHSFWDPIQQQQQQQEGGGFSMSNIVVIIIFVVMVLLIAVLVIAFIAALSYILVLQKQLQLQQQQQQQSLLQVPMDRPTSPLSASTSNSGGSINDSNYNDGIAATTTIMYDPSPITNREWNPFQLTLNNSNDGGAWISPLMYQNSYNTNDNIAEELLSNNNSTVFGYMMQPNIVQNHIVFISEGDLYWTTLPTSNNSSSTMIDPSSKPTSAIRLTYTIGNVRTPKINPIYPYLIAFTATYEARREVYILDLRCTTMKTGTTATSDPKNSNCSNGGGNLPAQRMTYSDNTNGILSVIGWNEDGTIITYSTTSLMVGLRDVRLYDLSIATTTSTVSQQQKQQQQQDPSTTKIQILETRPIPLSQAIDGVKISKIFHDSGGSSSSNGSDETTSNLDEDDECIIFVRYKQGSHTVRYVGGTTEQLWLYCWNETISIPLTDKKHDYIGTSKSPTIYTLTSTEGDDQRFLFFLSDRTRVDQDHPMMGPKVFYNYYNSNNSTTTTPNWRATSMNLFSVPLPNNMMDLYTSFQTRSKNNDSDTTKNSVLLPLFSPESIIQLTHISCQFDGMALQEYSVDASTGNVVLRIGADLYFIPAETIQSKLHNQNNKRSNKKSTTKTQQDSQNSDKPTLLPIHVLSDYHEQHERIVPIKFPKNIGMIDIFTTHYETKSVLLTVRGQLWVVPVLDNTNVAVPYQGSVGYNTPPRRYRVIPGSTTGGAIRVLSSLNIPLFSGTIQMMSNVTLSVSTSNTNTTNEQPPNTHRRLSLVLATDPASVTGEHAFFIVEVHADQTNPFNDVNHWPKPFLGGHVNGGSTKDGGLGTVRESSVTVSPCGRRFAWTDTDDRICVMTMPIYNKDGKLYSYHCLPPVNDQNEPLSGTLSTLQWSPGGRYLGVEHHALNQFSVLSIADCGSPEIDDGSAVADIALGSVVQITSSRFNSFSFTWGKSSFDVFWSGFLRRIGHIPPPDGSSTIYFLSDRDVVTDVKSPWGSRAPSPHFTGEAYVYALSLPINSSAGLKSLDAYFPGGGTAELFFNDLDKLKTIYGSLWGRDRRLQDFDIIGLLSSELNGRKLREDEKMTVVRFLQSINGSDTDGILGDDNSYNYSNGASLGRSPFPGDSNLDLPSQNKNLTLARKAYRLPRIPKGKYAYISVTDDFGFILLEHTDKNDYQLNYYQAAGFLSDHFYGSSPVGGIYDIFESTSRSDLCLLSSSGNVAVISKTTYGMASFLQDASWTQNQADVSKLAASVWPVLEYRQMYNDAWRLMRDYFYDANVHNVNWTGMHSRYSLLVQRCGKREELDDVLGQLASETSALHSFVYGGEYNSPDPPLWEPASLGVFMKRTAEWKGYMIVEIPQRDPDFDLVDSVPVYCPLSDQALRPTGQRGLVAGDVIVAVNGESVLSVPDINMLLRGNVGRSIRLEVLRLKSNSSYNSSTTTVARTESLIVVPISTDSADRLRYNAWEWKTRSLAKTLAEKAGFTVGYIHMQAMDGNGEDAFARGYFPDHDKDALILDVRHNNGGNIDSWIISTLQRKAFMYWAPRSGNQRFGELDWDEQFAFRGKLVVLVDESTSSNGEGVTRGLSELGLGKVIGTRTWGGGIWGSSVNILVDGGIAAAPQFGIFNNNFGWGGGIEMTGLEPDIIVDNEPRMTYDGRDMQLERAIEELHAWIQKDPTPAFKPPEGGRPDMSLHDDCPV